MFRSKVLVILGPTASGKSAVAVALAKKFNGEVVSADSRQVYRGLNIGSGKITRREMGDIPHHLLDVADPNRVFTVAQYQKLAREKIAEIQRRNKLPILCGGSPFYIQAVVDNFALPQVRPDRKLRARLNRKTAEELYRMLKRLDPERAKNIEARNPRRLIRAIEIAGRLGRVPKLGRDRTASRNFIIIGLKTSPKELRKNIHERLGRRMRAGLVEEVANLRKSGLSWKRLNELGLEYRHVANFLRQRQSHFRAASEPVSKRVKREEMTLALTRAIWRYAKRQLTWWKRDERIRWLTQTQALKLRLRSYNTGTAL